MGIYHTDLKCAHSCFPVFFFSPLIFTEFSLESTIPSRQWFTAVVSLNLLKAASSISLALSDKKILTYYSFCQIMTHSYDMTQVYQHFRIL